VGFSLEAHLITVEDYRDVNPRLSVTVFADWDLVWLFLRFRRQNHKHYIGVLADGSRFAQQSLIVKLRPGQDDDVQLVG
jgi:hypothetical protein